MSIRITRIKLRNFTGIKAGMNRKEIEIDFSKINDRVILLLGNNGSGKSTIQSTLHPFRETFDGRDSFILDGEEGLKEIDIQTEKSFYQIIHTYGSKNQSFIFKDGSEKALNGSGGIRTFISEVEKELGITPEHLKLLKIGSKTGNCIELNATERKNLLGKFTPSIDQYLEYYKIVNDKYNSFTKEIRFINDELANVGEEKEIVSQITLIEGQIKLLEREKKQVEKEITLKEVSLKNLTDESLDLIQSQTLLKELTVNLHETEKGIDVFTTKYPKIKVDELESSFARYTKLKEESLNSLNELKTKLTLTKNNIDNLQQNKSRNLSELSRIKNSKTAISKEEDLNKLMEEGEKSLAKLESQFNDLLSKGYDASKLNENESEEILDIIPLKSSKMLDLIFTNKNNLLALIPDETMESIVADYINQETLSELDAWFESTKNEIDSKKAKIERVIKEQARLSKEISLNNVTDLCVNKDCLVFKKGKENEERIKTFESNSELEKSLKEELNSLEEELSRMEKLKPIIDFFLNQVLMFVDIELSPVISANKELAFLCTDMKKIGARILTLSEDRVRAAFDQNPICVSQRVLSGIERRKRDLSVYKKEFQLNFSNFERENSLNGYIKELNDSINTLQIEERNIVSDISDKELIISRADSSLVILKTLSEMIDTKNSLLTEMQPLVKIVKKGEQSLITLKSTEEELNQLYLLIKEKEKQLEEFKPEYDKMRLSLERIKSYTLRKENIQNERNTLKVIKECLDIKTGIPLHILGKFLDNIKEETNNLLSLALKENFEIDFVVSDKEFSIPVRKNGVQYAKDISMCSQGEISIVKCAFSLGILNQTFKSSKVKYNIIQLDELDSEFDKHNSFSFLEVLNHQLDALNSSQTFVITHNNAFDRTQVGVILLKGSDIDTSNMDVMANKTLVADFR